MGMRRRGDGERGRGGDTETRGRGDTGRGVEETRRDAEQRPVKAGHASNRKVNETKTYSKRLRFLFDRHT